MTEAKLNYMIGETDAVLRSMCLDTDATAAATINTNLPAQSNTLTSPPLSSPLLSTSSDDNNHPNNPPTNILVGKTRNNRNDEDNEDAGDEGEEEEESLEELTRIYLESYREQLDRSRRELSERMELLEKEKERVARMSDARKREMHARRRAAVKAFRLERERELRNAQLAKIDELKARLDELNGVQSGAMSCSRPNSSDWLGHGAHETIDLNQHNG